MPYRLPDFTRLAWVHDRARTVWQPRLARAATAWTSLERVSVSTGLRRCALQSARPSDLPALAAAAAQLGLTALPLALEAGADSAGAYRVAIGSAADVLACRDAWERRDDRALGDLLGYPACCVAFFDRVWNVERCIDTTWAMARSRSAGAPVANPVDGTGPFQANILLRWLGVRLVPHLPCSPECEASVTRGEAFLRAGIDAGFREECDWIAEMLSWPAEWSALHGIAEIRTPVVKVVTNTDATAGKRVVRRRGTCYPVEGASGVAFPYNEAGRPRSGDAATSGSPRRLTVVRREGLEPRRDGFASDEAMRRAHAPIVATVARRLAGRPGTVLDLGCGTGGLLAAIVARSPGASLRGVERDADCAAAARRRLSSPAASICTADLFDDCAEWCTWQADVVLLMPGRLLEVEPPRAELLRDWLRRQTGVIVAYVYDDWLAREGSLTRLCSRAGLTVVEAAGAVAVVTVR